MRNSTFKDRRGFHIPGDDHRENTLSQEERKHIDHMVFNRWPPLLASAELRVVMFTYARTALHYQRWAYLSLNMLTHGYPYAEHKEELEAIRENPNRALKSLSVQARMRLDEGDHFIVAPTGLSKSNVQRAVTSLTNKGFLMQNAVSRTRNEMALNPDAHYCMTDILLPKRNAAKTTDGRKRRVSKYDIRG